MIDFVSKEFLSYHHYEFIDCDFVVKFYPHVAVRFIF